MAEFLPPLQPNFSSEEAGRRLRAQQHPNSLDGRWGGQRPSVQFSPAPTAAPGAGAAQTAESADSGASINSQYVACGAYMQWQPSFEPQMGFPEAHGMQHMAAASAGNSGTPYSNLTTNSTQHNQPMYQAASPAQHAAVKQCAFSNGQTVNATVEQSPLSGSLPSKSQSQTNPSPSLHFVSQNPRESWGRELYEAGQLPAVVTATPLRANPHHVPSPPIPHVRPLHESPGSPGIVSTPGAYVAPLEMSELCFSQYNKHVSPLQYIGVKTRITDLLLLSERREPTDVNTERCNQFFQVHGVDPILVEISQVLQPDGPDDGRLLNGGTYSVVTIHGLTSARWLFEVQGYSHAMVYFKIQNCQSGTVVASKHCFHSITLVQSTSVTHGITWEAFDGTKPLPDTHVARNKYAASASTALLS